MTDAQKQIELLETLIREVRAVRGELVAAAEQAKRRLLDAVSEASDQLDAIARAAQTLLELRQAGDDGPAGELLRLPHRPRLRPGDGDDGGA